jgi:arabinose-5-phosphate isomerase
MTTRKKKTASPATEPPAETPKLAPRERGWLSFAAGVIQTETDALTRMIPLLDASFAHAVDAVMRCRGHVVVCGVGKPGFVAQKLSATLASTGVPSFFLHPAEAMHGDLGRVREGDVAVVLSNSGRTEEVTRMLGPLKALNVTLVGITGERDSPLGKHSDILLDIGRVTEACPLGLAPTTSSTAMLVLGDALAMTVSHARQFSKEDFARFHPGGKLGRQLMRVREVMRAGRENPCVKEGSNLRHALDVMTNTPGRPGATHVVDGDGKLVGILTDGDLRRFLLTARGRPNLAVKVDALMVKNPKTVGAEALVEEALRVLAAFKIDQLPVVDADHLPVGLLDIQDVLAVRRV